MGRARRLRYRHLRRTVIAGLITAAVMLATAVGVVRLLESGPAQRLAIRWLEALADRGGISLDVGAVEWELLPPRIVLHDVHLTAALGRATIERAEVELADVRLTRRTIELGSIDASGVRVRLDEQIELPRRRGRPIRVAIHQLHLRDVSVEGLGLADGLALDVAGLTAAWTDTDGSPAGFVRIEQVRLLPRGLEPIEVSVRTRVRIAEGLVALPSWSIAGRGVDLSGRATLSSRRVMLDAAGTIDLAELDRVVHAGDVLAGTVRLSASLDTDREPLLRADIEAPRLTAADFPLGDLKATIDLTPDGLSGRLTHAELGGGTISADYRLGSLRAPCPHQVKLEGHGVALASILTALGVPPAGLAARAEIAGELEWVGDRLPAGRGRATARLSPTAGDLPVDGTLAVDLTPAGLLFNADKLRLGGSLIRWQGPLTVGTWEPSWSINASPLVLDEAIRLVNRWIGSEALPTSVTGNGELLVTLGGPWSRLLVNARLEAAPLVYPPMVFDRVLADVVVSDSRLDLGTVRYRIGDGGGEVDGSLDWLGTSGHLALGIRGREIPLAGIARWLDLALAVDGTASFTGGLRGTLAAPRGSWALGLDAVEVGGVAIGNGAATVDLDEGRFHARGVSFDGGLEGDAWWAVGPGEIGGHLGWAAMPLDPLGPDLADACGGVADVELAGTWPFDGYPDGTVSVAGSGLVADMQASPGGLAATLELVDGLTATAQLERQPDGGLIGDGTLRLTSARAVLDQLVARHADVPLEGSGAAELAISWPSGELPQVEGHLTTLDLALDRRPVRLLQPATFRLGGTGLEVDGVLLGLLGDEVFARWSIATDGQLRGNASGTIDALLLRFLLPDWEPAGRATGVVELLGTVNEPELEGVAQVDQMSFRLPGTRTVVSGVTGTVLLSSDRAVLEAIDFRLMRGTGRGHGQIERNGEIVSVALEGTVEGLEYPLFPGLDPRLSGSWRLSGPTDDLLLSGDLVVDRAVLRRKDDVATVLLDWFGGPETPPPEAGLRLDLRVEADRTIEARNPFLQLEASATLEISGSTSDLGLVGTVELQEGSELTFQGVRYEVARGTVTFTDPLRVAAQIDLELRAWVQNYQITVRLDGSPDRLVPSLSSDPPLTETEIYGLLALGVRDETVAGGAVPMGFASTLLTRELNAELERRTRLVLPVDQIRLDPFAESGTGNPAARITVVKQINPHWTVILQSNLSANREEVIVSRWYLGTGLFIEATRDVDGTYAVDLKLRRRY